MLGARRVASLALLVALSAGPALAAKRPASAPVAKPAASAAAPAEAAPEPATGRPVAQFLAIFGGVVVAMTLAGWVLRARRGRRSHPVHGAPAADSAIMPRQYSPDKVGNDASARPWERASMAFDSAKYAQQAAPKPAVAIPTGFDADAFVAAAKANFMALQDAWDRADLILLRSMMTDEMLAEIKSQLAEREKQLAGEPNRTEVVMLEARLLGIEDLGAAHMASVEFSGMIREDPSAGPAPFREVWSMTKPKDGASGWLVAGVQALQ